MQPYQHQVIIAGGGPTGLMLAGELALAGVDVAIVERRVNQDVEGSRAGGLHPRTIEALDQRGIADRFIAQGTKHYAVPFAGTILDASDRPTRHNYTLGLWQEKIEHGLADWVSELGVTVYRGSEVTGFEQDESGVDVTTDDGGIKRAQYLVGCDGGRSLVRKQAGIAFPGWEADISYLIYEANMTDEPAFGMRHGPRGVYALGRLEDGQCVRGVVTEERLERGDQPDVEALRAALIAAYGSDFGVHNVTWLSRFTDAARQAASYRAGRVLLAGDAAHVHSPTGGQGLNIGIQDAVNLGWKLAQVVKGISPDTLLDTYQAERHPVGAAVIRRTLALTALNRGDERTNALREMMAEVMRMDQPRKWYAALISGLDIRYDLGDDHPLVGSRMPDLELVTQDGPTHVFSLLHDGLPLLLYFGESGGLDITGWDKRLKVIEAGGEDAGRLSVFDPERIPPAVLIRPDGHVAWVGDAGETGLNGALEAWFGITPAAPGLALSY